MTTIRSPSRLLDYLPVIYRDDPFVGQFLLAFEDLLLGTEGDRLPKPLDLPESEGDRSSKLEESQDKPIGLEVQIANIATYFDPLETPKDFLPWLASWTALTLRADLDSRIQRKFIANIMSYYRFRGTKANLQKLLSLFVRGTPTIEETSNAEFQIGKHSTIGKDTYLRGGTAHFFKVTIVLPKDLQGEPKLLERQLAIARSIIELEKPAHTDYELNPIYPGTIQIGKVSTVGVDTLLGNIPTDAD